MNGSLETALTAVSFATATAVTRCKNSREFGCFPGLAAGYRGEDDECEH
jgi:hypothetical protein